MVEVEAAAANGDGATKAGELIKASINENDDRKLFVGSLAWETTEAQFKEYFSKFGGIKEATIKLDPMGRSKGFGFILFEETSAVDKVLAEESHSLGNRKIEPKKATPKEKCKKIFVGGVSPDFPEADIRKHFEQYGEIEEMECPMNKEKNIRKGGFYDQADLCF
jgi:heterogeneous nuclear ribonucleoprotein A/B/D